MDIEHDPHGQVSPLGLVQLLHGVEGEQAASDDKESIDAEESIPEDCGRQVVCGLTFTPISVKYTTRA